MICERNFYFFIGLMILCGCGKLNAIDSSQSPTTPALSVSDASSIQGTTLHFPVTLSTAASQDVNFSYQLNPGTATAGVQYTDTSGTVTIPKGSTSSVLSIPTLEDGLDKSSSSFSVSLSGLNGATLLNSTATGTINDATLLYNFMTGSLPTGTTFARSTSALAYNSSGLLVTVAANTPRFDYHPTTHALKGLLIERNSANQVFYSEDFSQSNWAKTNSSISSASISTPTGSANGSTLTENTTNSVHSVSQVSLSYTAVYPITVSIFAKANARTKIRLRVSDGTNGFYSDCDLSTTVNVTTSSTPSVEGSVLASGSTGSLSTLQNAGVAGGAGIDDAGSGWMRCWVSGVMPLSDVSTSNVMMKVSLISGTSESYLGDGASGVSIWGAQYEEVVSVPTSYIATAATSGIGRDADDLTISPFGSWYSNNDFTANITYMRRWFEKPYDPNLNVSAYPTAFMFYNAGSFTNHFGAQYSTDGTNILFNWTASSSFITGATSSANQNIQGSPYKVGIKRSSSTLSLSVNGSSPIQASGSVTSTTFDTLGIGTAGTGGSGFNGYIQRFSYRPRAVPDAQFSVLTQ